MNRHFWIACSLLTVCLVIATAPTLQAEDGVGVEDGVGAEEPGFHGMLVVGSETIYMSHLPMFMPQHRYQGLWEVSFGEEADQQYREKRRRPENAGRIFTLAPLEDFRLPELSTTRDSFPAALFIGHFEREDRELLLDDVTVTLKQRIHWHPFRNHHARPEQLTYVLFGQGGETFLSHWITVAPSYHQILAVNIAAPIDQAVQVVLPNRADDEPLKVGATVAGLAIMNGEPEQPIRVQAMELRVDAEIFLEQGELARNGLDELEETP